MPDNYWDEKGETVKGAELRKTFDELSSFKATQDIRAETVPKSAREYEYTLPENFQLPEGAQWQWDEKSPYLQQAREIAHKQGRTQEEFSELLGVYAAAKMHEAQEFDKLREEQIKQLGATGPARVEAIQTFLKAQGATDIAVQWWTAKGIQQFEKLITRFSSQGAGTFSQQHRDNETKRTLTDDEYNKMSFAQKREYANKHQQSASDGRAA